MTKEKKIFSALAALLGVFLVLVIVHSRRANPKPVAVPEKKIQVIEIAPTPLPLTGIVRNVRNVDTNAPGYTPPHPSTSTPETKKALRDRQRVFMKKVIEAQLAKEQAVYDQELQELAKREIEVRTQDPLVSVAYAKVIHVRAEYEDTCMKSIQGYADQVKESTVLRASLDDILSRKNKGEIIVSNVVAGVYRRVNDALSKISRMRDDANASVPEVARALQHVFKVQGDYEECLLRNNEYSQAKKRPDEILAEINRLTHMQEQK